MADHELHQLAKTIRYDLTALQAKVSELLRQTAGLEQAPDTRRTCPECGPIHLPQGTTMSDHLHRAHEIDDVPPRHLRGL